MTKDHILREIRRTAEANGGASLGKDRFFQETGIKEADWKGKFWARWSDAIREAGFQPNQFSTTPHDESLMLEKLVGLIRELGRFPVTAEIRLRKRVDPSIPNEKTFRRFGSRSQLLQKVLEYCRSRAGYEDIAEVCRAAANNHRTTKADQAGVVQSDSIGFVYLIKSGRNFKIGRSNSVGRREYELAIQLPDKASQVHAIRTDDPVGIEAYWHRRFESKRKNGEWFELSAADIASFRRRKFM